MWPSVMVSTVKGTALSQYFLEFIKFHIMDLYKVRWTTFLLCL